MFFFYSKVNLAQTYPHIEAIVVDASGRLHYSRGLEPLKP